MRNKNPLRDKSGLRAKRFWPRIYTVAVAIAFVEIGFFPSK